MPINTKHPFWKHVRIRRRTRCWQWLASKRGDGYGQYYFNHRNQGAHRVAYQLAVGPIPNGKHICHKCDNKECVNPTHFYVSTNKQNHIDAGQRGLLRHGESHPLHKLTEKQVLAIRRRYKPHLVTMQMLATEYGVAMTCIQSVIEMRTWKLEGGRPARFNGYKPLPCPSCRKVNGELIRRRNRFRMRCPLCHTQTRWQHALRIATGRWYSMQPDVRAKRRRYRAQRRALGIVS